MRKERGKGGKDERRKDGRREESGEAGIHRKAVPEWSVPLEAWRMVFLPDSLTKQLPPSFALPEEQFPGLRDSFRVLVATDGRGKSNEDLSYPAVQWLAHYGHTIGLRFPDIWEVAMGLVWRLSASSICFNRTVSTFCLLVVPGVEKCDY